MLPPPFALPSPIFPSSTAQSSTSRPNVKPPGRVNRPRRLKKLQTEKHKLLLQALSKNSDSGLKNQVFV